MTVLRVEHQVRDYDAWKEAFDSDPVGREASGVRRYRILQSMDDPNYVMVDLEFDAPGDAVALLASIRAVWGRVQDTLISDPRARIAEPVETTEY